MTGCCEENWRLMCLPSPNFWMVLHRMVWPGLVLLMHNLKLKQVGGKKTHNFLVGITLSWHVCVVSQTLTKPGSKVARCNCCTTFSQQNWQIVDSCNCHLTPMVMFHFIYLLALKGIFALTKLYTHFAWCCSQQTGLCENTVVEYFPADQMRHVALNKRSYWFVSIKCKKRHSL